MTQCRLSRELCMIQEARRRAHRSQSRSQMPPSPAHRADEPEYRVRLNDPDGTSQVIFGAPDDDDDPSATGTFEYTEADPVLAELARNPYDPLVAARAGGRLMGLAVTQPQNEPWMRVIGGFIGLALFVV